MQEARTYYRKRYEEDDDENFVQDVLVKYLPYWPLFLILLGIGLTCAFVYLRYATPIYQTFATVLIKDERKGLNESKMMEALDLFGSKKIVENEIEILRSHTIAKQVVRNLHLYAQLMEEGKVKSISAYTSSPVIVELKNPDSLLIAKKVFFTFNSNTSKVEMNGLQYSLHTWFETPFGTMRFLPNSNYIPPTTNPRLYFSLVSVADVADGILERLEAEATSKQSSVVNLSFADAIPRRGRDVLNQIISVYNKASIEDKNLLASNTLQFVEERLQYVVNELDSVERQLEQYKTRNKILDISAQGQLFLQGVSENDKKAGEITLQLAVLDDVEAYVMSKSTGRGIVPATLGVQDPVLSALLARLYDAEMQYKSLKETTAENNPVMIALQDQIDQIRPDILENIRNQRRSLRAGRGSVNDYNEKFASMLAAMPQKERQLLEISRQQAIKNSIFTFLLQKREETALSYASTVGDTRIVDDAQTIKMPISPNQLVVYLIGFAGALGVGIAFVTIKDLLNTKLHFKSEIEKYTSIPILGEISKSRSQEEIVIAEGKRTLIAEQFRHLRSSLGYLGINSRKKKVLITSTISGEGKSFVALNLGASLALMGKKVALLELDLRRPQLSNSLGLDGKANGISAFLIGESDLDQVIMSTGIHNLFLVPSGPIPPNPSELLMNGRLEELLQSLEDKFDFLILDTAPVLPVTDAFILAPLCDATLYVVRYGYTLKNYVKSFDEKFEINNLKNSAIIFNGINDNGSGYGYGSGYEYRYRSQYITESERTTKRKKYT